MKKISLFFITAVMILSLCACGREESSPATCTDLTEEQLQELIEEIQREQESQQAQDEQGNQQD